MHTGRTKCTHLLERDPMKMEWKCDGGDKDKAGREVMGLT